MESGEAESSAEGRAVKKHKLQPRSYQIEALNKALKENIILYLETGTGKTQIAAMLINSFKQQLSMPSEKRIAVFLAPYVHLVVQQARYLSDQTDLIVGEYYGDKGVDTWSLLQWQEEVNAHQVFVMTPQVFLDALGTSALKLETVVVLVIDECHHAQNNHPYALIMKTHYHVPSLNSKPKIFGMSASPIIKKGVSSDDDCAQQIRALENTLDAKVYTEEISEAFAPKPIQKVEIYDRPLYDFVNLKDQLDQLLRQYIDNFTGEPCADVKVIKSVKNLHSTILYCLDGLGLLAAKLAVDELLNVDENQQYCMQNLSPEQQEAEKAYREEMKSHKERFLESISSAFSDVPNQVCGTVEEMIVAERGGVITSKVMLLLNILLTYRDTDDLRCIVFVERVIVSMVLAKLITYFQFLTHVHCGYMVGVHSRSSSRTPSRQRSVLDQFATGELNLLISTSVSEEGLDVQTCSAVIRFDLCQTLRSHVQSRGRARRAESTYIWFLESGNQVQENLLLQLTESEQLVKEQVSLRNDMNVRRESPPLDDLEFFRVESGACKSSQDSVGFIHKYCDRLPGDRYYKPRPVFSFDNVGTFSTCTIKFPPNAPLSSVEGPPRRTVELAKKAACLQACRELYEIGAVRPDTLCPDPDDVDEEETVMQKDASLSGWYDLCSSGRPLVFKGTWINSQPPVRFHSYRLSFSTEPVVLQTYAKFALLVEGPFEEELGKLEVKLYTTENRVVIATVCPYGLTELDMHQVNAARAFHELLFNGAFRRLGPDLSEEGLWDESEAYLLLPINDEDDCIDWEGVFSSAEALETIRGQLPIRAEPTNDSNIIHTAGGNVHVSMLQDSLIVAVHSGTMYCVSGLIEEMTAEACLVDKRQTYVEYYKEKYNKQLSFPTQRLLCAKAPPGFRNLLTPRWKEEPNDNDAKKRQKRSTVELPPELCLVLGLNSSVIRSLYFIPSFMHRFSSAICAAQMRSTIFSHCPWIPTLEIVEALTSKKCQEGFSFEALELLGDSFLKYVISRRLFLLYADKNEGQLSARRSRATCNATLNNLAKASGVSEYIRDRTFIPFNWPYPGMYGSEHLSCQHDLSHRKTSKKDNDIEKVCIKGHRWIRWKVLADTVEALIGVYFVNGGPEAAEEVMKTLGIDVEFDKHLIHLARQWSSPLEQVSERLYSSLSSLENKLHYTFHNKALLLQAVTHASTDNASFCYQRLEFLGDAALDFVVTKYLFQTHPGLSPGVLTDLRSATTNNGFFARVVLKHDLNRHLRHGAEKIFREINDFVRLLNGKTDGELFGFEGSSGPKVLADLLESIAGAILVDTGFDLERLREVMQPLLSPMVTPETLPLHPVRELQEICDSNQFECKFNKGDPTGGLKFVEITVTAGERRFVETSCDKKKKTAEKAAAQKMLVTLRENGFKHSRHVDSSNRNQMDSQDCPCVSPALASSVASTDSAFQPLGTAAESSVVQHVLSPQGDKDTATINMQSNVEPKDHGKGLASPAQGTSNFLSEQPFRVQEVAPLPGINLAVPNQPAEYAAAMGRDANSYQQPFELNPFLRSTSSSSERGAIDPQEGAEGPPSPSSVALPDFIACRLEFPGGGRQFLGELCAKRRWQLDFNVKDDGDSVRRFRCSVQIVAPGRDTIVEEGCFMANKKKATDDAARRMIFRLASLNILDR